MKIDDIDTPAVLVDLDRVEANLLRFQGYCDRHRLKNRPHIKTHKIPDLAKRQLALGAAGITCQKLGEAEVMADAGIGDILVTYNILGAAKLARAVALARRVRLSVTCDDIEVARGLSEAFAGNAPTLPVLVECDTGAKRCGVQTPRAAVDLALAIDRLSGLSFAGFMTYPPKLEIAGTAAFFAEAMALCRSHGLEAVVVSSGGTPDMWRAAEVPEVTEYRVGTYIYNDRMIMAAGAAQLDECALTVLSTVVSRPTGERAVLDAGSKALSSDSMGAEQGYGLITAYPLARIHKLNEEHGTVDLSGSNERPRIGERIRVVPNHACVVSNLFDRVYGIQGDHVVEEWEVAARGRMG